MSISHKGQQVIPPGSPPASDATADMALEDLPELLALLDHLPGSQRRDVVVLVHPTHLTVMSVSTLAAEVGISPEDCRGHVAALVADGVLAQADDGTYRIVPPSEWGQAS